jgi:hypothetical protein
MLVLELQEKEGKDVQNTQIMEMTTSACDERRATKRKAQEKERKP